MRGTWQTDSSSAGPLVLVVAVAVAVAVAAGPVVHAAEDLVKILLIAAAVLAGLAVAAGIGLLAWHRHRTPPIRTVEVLPPARDPQRAVQARTASQGVLPPQIHLHLHGDVSPEAVAAIISRQQQAAGRPAIEED